MIYYFKKAVENHFNCPYYLCIEVHINHFIFGGNDLKIEELKDITLRFKGSSNQRVIDVQKSLKENKIVLSIYNDKKNSDFHKIY